MTADSRQKRVTKVEDLEVFRIAHDLAVDIYRLTQKFPAEEKFGLVSQMRRAASSIAANLMEGGHRLTKKEFRHFVGIAKGSAGEMKYYALLARDLGYIAETDFRRISEGLDDIGKMLYGLVRSLTDTGTVH